MIDSREHTVTLNGVNHLSAFDRTGAWPVVSPGASSLTIDPASAVTVAWRPRLMGLL